MRCKMSVTILVMFLTTSCTGGEIVTLRATLLSPPTTRPPEPTNTPIPTVIEPGLAYGIPCKPPCWQGLIPGESTAQEAKRAIEQLRTSGWANRVGGSSEGYFVEPSPFTTHGSIYVAIEGDIVTEIGGTTLFYYPVGTLVEQFGGPEGIYVGSSAKVCSSCKEWEPPDPPNASVMSIPGHLLYPSQGLWFEMLVPLSGLGCICPEMKVTAFHYSPVMSMPGMLNREYPTVRTDMPSGITEEDMVEWHGFGGGY